jgi:hypothetical protein
MPASGYILVLLSLSDSPAKPHTIMKKFETLELCQAAARAAAAPGTLADCLPQAERQGSTTKQGEDTSHPATRPPSKRSITSTKRLPDMRGGILTPPSD